MSHARDQHLERNYRAFNRMTFPESQTGRFALLRNEEVVEVYDEMLDALESGRSMFKDTLFSIQEINPVPPRIGGLPRKKYPISPERAREIDREYKAVISGKAQIWEIKSPSRARANSPEA